ncbi:protein PSK SIMULATOR 1-like [Tasmannia lanceolata]|uniref:protein PSK SIMULATOR 1-like n=1 Tax=Tasmannia lanceolata TaxID=3420 RepID=UPI00406398EB
MIWFSDTNRTAGNGFRHSDRTKICRRFRLRSEKPPIIGILAFETAKIMSRLVSLYKSLSDEEINKLRLGIIRSEGVRYLNSKDEGFLFRLACAEKIEDLDRAALAVARLGMKCLQPELQGFESVYTDLKLGFIDLAGLGFPEKKIDRKIAKMEKFIAATSDLYTGLEALTEMEVSERKLQQWKSYSGPIAVKKVNSDLFEEKISWQRNHVRRVRHISLWSQSFEKIVSLMARIVCNVFVRICIVFGPYVSDLPQVILDENLKSPPKLQIYGPHCPIISASGPLERTVAKPVIMTNSCPLSYGFTKKQNRVRNGKAYREVSGETVGGAAMAIRYANVIILAEKFLNYPESVDLESRESLYEMLPWSLRVAVREKMRKWRREEEGFGFYRDLSLAEGWREGLEGILGWLGPMAHDMIRWQGERNMERKEFSSGPTVLLLQTLYFSDMVKTEAAIAEVLAGLSYIFRYENRW